MNKTIVYALMAVFFVSAQAAHAQQKRHIIKIGQDAVVEENADIDSVVAVGGNVTVNGTVEESAVAVGGNVTLGPAAVVRESAVAVGGAVIKDGRAVVEGDIVEVSVPGVTSRMSSFLRNGLQALYWTMRAAAFIGFLVLGLLVAILIPEGIERTAGSIESGFVRVMLLAIAGVVLIVPVFLLTAASLIGIIFIPVEIILLAFAYLAGYVAVAQIVGKRILRAMRRKEHAVIWNTLAGLIALWVVSFVPVLGWIVLSFVLLVGFGGVLAAVLGRRTVRAT